MTCKICASSTRKLFDKKILGKYTSTYHQCVKCNFIQTDKPVWLQEAYGSAITAVDIGLVDRNLVLLEEGIRLIDGFFPAGKNFLDYAGGYGLFVRLMRDKGFNFFRQDIYCENIFAKHFDLSDCGVNKFDVVTAFEVFEHFEHPIDEINKLFSFSDNVVFSTKLLPHKKSELESWWYLAPETGQHIAFYDAETLRFIAAQHGKQYYFNGKNLHLFTSESPEAHRIQYALDQPSPDRRFPFFGKKVPDFHVERQSLLQSDYEYVKSLLIKNGG